jgi:hypothetical protein
VAKFVEIQHANKAIIFNAEEAWVDFNSDGEGSLKVMTHAGQALFTIGGAEAMKIFKALRLELTPIDINSAATASEEKMSLKN